MAQILTHNIITYKVNFLFHNHHLYFRSNFPAKLLRRQYIRSHRLWLISWFAPLYNFLLSENELESQPFRSLRKVWKKTELIISVNSSYETPAALNLERLKNIPEKSLLALPVKVTQRSVTLSLWFQFWLWPWYCLSQTTYELVSGSWTDWS